MARYSSSINGIGLSGTHMRTFPTVAITAQGGSYRIYEIFLAGEAASSNNYRVGLNRPSAAGVTSTGTQTAEKLHPQSPAAGVVPVTTWTTNPTTTTNDAVLIAFNGFGGAVKWNPPIDGEVWALAGVAQGQIVMLSRNGSGNVSGHVLWEEF